MQHVGYSYIENYLKDKGVKFLPYPLEMAFIDNPKEFEEFFKDVNGFEKFPGESFAYRRKKGLEFEPIRGGLFLISKMPQTLIEHIVFAIEMQPINLLILKKVFDNMDKKDVQNYVLEKPTGKYHRKLWFLYEFLTNRTLEIDDLPKKNYIDLLDKNEYFTAPAIKSKRHAINNNLLGNKYFSPVVRKIIFLAHPLKKEKGETKVLRDKNRTDELKKRAQKVLKEINPQVIYRAINYLYDKETQDSFTIERAKASPSRLAKFAAILESQSNDPMDVTQASLVKLQHSFADERYHDDPYRKTQAFISGNAYLYRSLSYSLSKKVDFVCAKPNDIQSLMDGLLDCYNRVLSEEVDPIIAAAVVAFGFVYIHPFQDGNGRIHRYLIHNLLAKKDFSPKEIVFPISAYMLKNLKNYQKALNVFSKPLMQVIDYEIKDGFMEVSEGTADFYRYIDLTAQAGYLFECIENTIDTEFKQEIEYIVKSDETKIKMQEIVDMPNDRQNFFIALACQNNGKLAKSKRSHFDELTDEEVAKLESIIQKYLI